MTKEELEVKIESLRTMVQESQVQSSNYIGKLADAEKQLKDYNKIALPPAVFDEIYTAVENAVEQFDFSDTENFDIEYGIEYDGRVHCESHEMSDSSHLIDMIVEKVSRLFTEAECPEELDTTEVDNHKPVE